MRIVHLSTRDSLAGAYRATNRLHQGLRQAAVDSQMLVARKYTDDPTVHLPTAKLPSRLYHGVRMWRESQPQKAYPQRKDILSPAVVSANLQPALRRLQPDLIHLHWIAHGFVRPEDFAKWRRPLVWTLYDMWGFTGGCHYSGECTKYVAQCGACPLLGSSQEQDMTRRTWQTKQQAWEPLDFTVVTPSRWLAGCARQSSLFRQKRIEVIPSGLDATLYHPMPRAEVRAQLALPQDAKLILFGAMSSTTDRRKGYHLLLPALHRLAQDPAMHNVHVVVVGATGSNDATPLPIPIHFAGYIHDESRLAALYAAADLFVAPSLEDNLPNTVMEAIACGTPTVAFNIGGMADLIEHERNGYLAAPFEVESLAQGMAWVLTNETRHRMLAERARAKFLAEFALDVVAKRHVELYAELVQAQHDGRLTHSRQV